MFWPIGKEKMDPLLITAFVLLSVLCLIGLIATPLGLPGTFVILAGAVLFNLVQWKMAISLWVLVLLLALAVSGEILEYWLGVRLAARRGASGAAIAGAIVGGLIGAFAGVPVPVIGSVIGLFLGVFLGALLVELVLQKSLPRAWNAAIGAFYGRAGAILVKSMVGVAMAAAVFAAAV